MIIIYLSICLFIGLLGINKKLGFWVYFLGSVVFTPVVGILLLCASDKRENLK